MDAKVNFDKTLLQRLHEREAEGLLRTLVCPDNKIDFSSNDYLGLSQSAELKKIVSPDLPTGSTGSRLVTGNSLLAEETEQLIAKFHKAEAALIFNTGYMANTGLLSCIANKGDTFIADEYVHASIIDGMRLSHANRYKFKHNDLSDLEKKLQQASGNKFIIVESIYSMDGDEAPLVDIVALAEKYRALVIVDEAHANGVFGDNGEGLVVQYNLQNKVYACIYTFGKALGLHGAVITGTKALRQYLINYSRSFIYTTALPPHMYLQIQQVYQLLPVINRKVLYELITYFRAAVEKTTNISFIKSHSPIQGIIIGDNLKAKALAKHLLDKGFFIKAILSPTVPAGTERLRICLHTFNTFTQIDELLAEVKSHLLR
ncbi:aminotransferase class I/II-fold pyridoxal phosphate-dependent enzyme [Ferruginibacter albus]|uniref:aminotransferase class I/II-fold pyridoxal phosphate-dependent enzyme n=1 Tax=Ferruginibacter albus TaxID=2875540 RepID=UPI001CC48F7A|nr:8-amino-7-oxononanoate synthase [Ferruginibacter albus]UAY53307.1 8-amino-7-oxononanoate synthase [Ferruginibacter albus]